MCHLSYNKSVSDLSWDTPTGQDFGKEFIYFNGY